MKVARIGRSTRWQASSRSSIGRWNDVCESYYLYPSCTPVSSSVHLEPSRYHGQQHHIATAASAHPPRNRLISTTTCLPPTEMSSRVSTFPAKDRQARRRRVRNRPVLAILLTFSLMRLAPCHIQPFLCNSTHQEEPFQSRFQIREKRDHWDSGRFRIQAYFQGHGLSLRHARA